MSTEEDDKELSQAEIDAEIATLTPKVMEAVKETPLKDTAIKDRYQEEMQYKVIRDLWHCILDDSWMYVVVWSQPRQGKSTCKMRILNCIYHDWEMVLDSVVFNLSGFLYKMDHRQPMCIWENKHLHFRIPGLIGDDWGANANKAKTQHEPAWDLVKGAWDTYGTRALVFLSV